jgi:uncharacterized protein YukE
VVQSWVGGDLAGMQQMGLTIKAAPGEMKGVVQALSSKVDGLVGDAGWQGDAAEGFRKAWTANAIQAGGLSDAVGQVGEVMDGLAAKLQDIENSLYNAAHEAQKQGVAIGARGEPQPMASSGDTTSPQAAAVQKAAADYADTYNSALQLAKGYRLNAATQLSNLYDQISFDPGKMNNPDQWVTIGDYIRGLYALPGERNYQLKGELGGKIADARDRMKDARKALKAERDAYQAKGLKLPIDNDARLAHSGAVKELKGLETDLAAAEAGKGELPLTKALNTHLADVAKEIPQLGAVADALPKGLDFLKDIPVIDVAASGVAAELQARDDINKGWSPDHARAADYGAAGVGLVGGAGLGALAAAVGASTGGAALVGGAAVVGIGDLAYQGFHEHWAEDIHQDGVVGGVLTGTGHMFENTGKDVGHMATGVWHGAESVWHSVFD